MHIFGEMTFVHVPHENKWKLDNRALKGNVVMNLANSKDWVFYIPVQKKFIFSEWAVFLGSSAISRILAPAKENMPSKGSLSFLLNSLTLGNFSSEKQVEAQDLEAHKPTNISTDPSYLAPRLY
ncbi:hypothetical protein O181_011708 [Austropuccinia psidii MF-1]|uniref:Retroviral polymerase SH3-like domain-containing protein n=1 Tax=Austropuccinia psidii MF-1 TaxID=1389203 RepID=A0A9Q3BVD3_9BASI|nr:hypothetical protein [Austropuccinia psidii MF-1]